MTSQNIEQAKTNERMTSEPMTNKLLTKTTCYTPQQRNPGP